MEKKIARHLKRLQNDAYPENNEKKNSPKLKKKLGKLRSHIQGGKDWIFLLLLVAALLKDIYDIASAGFLAENGIMDSSLGGGSEGIISELIQEVGEIGAAAFLSWYLGGALAIPVAVWKIIKWLWRIGKFYYYIKGIITAFGTGVKLAAAIIAPFIFNVMFLWLTFFALLLSGKGKLLNRWKAILAGLFIEFVAESFFGLNWFPGATVFTVLLYYFVLRKRRKQSQKEVAPPSSAEPIPQYADNYWNEAEREAA